MKIELEPTGRFATVNGAQARIWKGKTDKGVELEAFICFLKVHRDADNSEFEKELREVQPERQLASFDYRLAL